MKIQFIGATHEVTGSCTLLEVCGKKYLVDCGGDAFSLQQIMGHSTLKMTRHYCNIFNDDIIENHEQRSPLAQLTKSKRQTIKK